MVDGCTTRAGSSLSFTKAIISLLTCTISNKKISSANHVIRAMHDVSFAEHRACLTFSVGKGELWMSCDD